MRNRILLLCTALLLSSLSVVYGQQADDARSPEKEPFLQRLFGRKRTEQINTVQAVERTRTLKLGNEPFVPASALLTDFSSVVPADAGTVELSLITPQYCWLTEGNAMNIVNPSRPIYSQVHYKYAQLSDMNTACTNNGTQLIPVFGLTTICPHFKEVTGHDMLSVEGVRFVLVLLDEFIENTNFTKIKIVLPEGSYRRQLEEFFSYYPEVSEVIYTTE